MSEIQRASAINAGLNRAKASSSVLARNAEDEEICTRDRPASLGSARISGPWKDSHQANQIPELLAAVSQRSHGPCAC
jgi:hypothetical protein